MKINQMKSVHHWIRNSNPSEILFVTALFLPLYLLLYNTVIEKIYDSLMHFGLIIALLLYVVGIIWMKRSQTAEESKFRDLLIIKNYMLDKEFSFMSFDRIKGIDNRLNESRVKELLFAFPSEIRLAKLKENKRGIKILNIEDDEEVE